MCIVAVRLMTPGEVSLITSTSQYAYDGRPDRPPRVPEGAKVEWEVELISFQKQPDWERAEPDAKIKHAGTQLASVLFTLVAFHRHAEDTQLSAGDAQLKDGAAQLNAGDAQLNDGAAQLNAGDAQLHDGAAQPNAGDAQLNDGAAQLNAGDAQLSAQTKHAIRQECCN